MAAGRFITFEGGEGAGKSTAIRSLATALGARSIPVVLTREPGGSLGAEAIRELLVSGDPGRWDGLTEALLHYAARRDHLVRTIAPALAEGQWVLCDRFNDSTIAYQGYGHGVDLATLKSLYQMVVGDLTPDLTLILDVPVELGLQRAGRRAGLGIAETDTRYERMTLDFHHRLREGFQAIAKAEPQRCAVIDATASTETVAAAIMAEVIRRLPVTP